MVEQLGVQPGHAQTLALELLAQHPERVVLAVRSDVRRPSQPAQLLVVVGLRQHVGALHALQLQAVFEQPQEFVGRSQVGGVVAADVSPGAQCGQRVDRRCDVQRLVVAAVHQLQQLDRELDVAQSAGTEFELAGAFPCGDEFLDAPSHGLHLGDEVLALAGRPHHGHHRRDVLRAEFGGHRRRAGP